MLIVFQRRDGPKLVPHVVSVTGNMDRGMMAFISNSLQRIKKENSKQKLQRRKVKTHKLLAGGFFFPSPSHLTFAILYGVILCLSTIES